MWLVRDCRGVLGRRCFSRKKMSDYCLMARGLKAMNSSSYCVPPWELDLGFWNIPGYRGTQRLDEAVVRVSAGFEAIWYYHGYGLKWAPVQRLGTKMKTGPVDQRGFRQKPFSALNMVLEELTQNSSMTVALGSTKT